MAKPREEFLLLDHELIRGTAFGRKQVRQEPLSRADAAVFPGERLIVHFENGPE